MTSLQIKTGAARLQPQAVLERQQAATRRKRWFYLALFAVALVAPMAIFYLLLDAHPRQLLLGAPMLLLAFWVAWAATGCTGAETSVAATRPMARVRARAAALKLALLCILLTPNRNFGHLVAARHPNHGTTARSRPIIAARRRRGHSSCLL